MKFRLFCTECNCFTESYYCDICGLNLEKTKHSIPVTISFGYGSSLDEGDYHFCSYDHAVQFLLGELRKQNPRTNIEFGKESN